MLGAEVYPVPGKNPHLTQTLIILTRWNAAVAYENPENYNHREICLQV